MQRAFVLVVLFAMMVGLRRQGVDLLPGETDPLTLASIGFTALFAFTIGEVANGLGLPRVSGYILTGVLLGPHVSEVLSQNVVTEMKMFNTLALGLIATTAGLELDLKGLAKAWKTLLFTVILKLVFLLIFVIGTFVAIQHFFNPFDLSGMQATVAVGLIIAVLGLGTSPAIVLAVINDSKSTGTMSDLLLAMAVVKDLVVVVSLAIALAVAKVMLVPDGHFDLHVLVHVAQELGLSIGVGLVVGAVCIAYIRFIHAEMLLFVVAMILTVAQLSQVWHLEVLLVFIVAGFLVRNASPHEHELLHPLETVALPVFVVFFTTAGAAVDLQGTWQVLPYALALFFARGVAMYLSGRFGGQMGGEEPHIYKRVWMGYIPQAGVTLGLLLIAGNAIPAQAELIGTLGTAIVAINLFVGPVTLSKAVVGGPEALGAAEGSDGEPEALKDDDHMHAHDEAGAIEVAAPSLVGGPLKAALDYPQLQSKCQVWGIEEPVLEVFDALTAAFDKKIAQQKVENQHLLSQFKGVVEGRGEGYERLRVIRRHLQNYEAPTQFISQMRDEVSTLFAISSSTPTHWDLNAQALEGRGAGGVFALFKRGKLHRDFPLRTTLRMTLEGRLLQALAAYFERGHRSRAVYFHRLSEHVRGLRSAEAIVEAYTQDLEAAGDLLWSDCQFHLQRALEEFLEGVDGALAQGHPWRALRYGDVEPVISRAMANLEAEQAQWQNLLGHQSKTALMQTLLRSYEHRLQIDVSGKVCNLITEAVQMAADEAGVVRGRLEQIQGDCRSLDGETIPTLTRLLERAKQTLDRRQRAKFRRASARLRHYVLSKHFEEILHRLVEEVPDHQEVISAETPLVEVARIGDIRLVQIPLFSIVEREFTDQYTPLMIRFLVETRDHMAEVEGRLREAVQVASFAMENAIRGDAEDENEGQKWALDGLNRACERIKELEEELLALRERAHVELSDLPIAVFERIQGDVRVSSALDRRRLQGRSSLFELRQNLRKLLLERGQRLRGNLQHWSEAFKRLLQSRNIQAWRIRAGLEELDPSQMADYVKAHLPLPEDLEIPPFYQRLFITKPLDDSRFYIPRDGDPLQRLRGCITQWNQGQRVSALLVGQGGAGKTSVLNLIHPRLSGISLLRLDGEGATRNEGLIAAMAAELDCSPDPQGVKVALERQRTAVLVDDLEHWFHPTMEGMAQFERVVQMMVSCNAQVLWIISVNTSAMERLQRLFDLRGAFSHHIELNAFSAQECEAFIEARHRLSGLELQVRHPAASPLPLQRLLPSAILDRYYEDLVLYSGGNPRDVAYLHLLGTAVSQESVQAGPIPVVDLPFMARISGLSQVICAELSRLGELPREDLLALLGVSPRELEVSLRQLMAAHILEEGPTGVQIPIHLRFLMRRVLVERRLLAGEGV